MAGEEKHGLGRWINDRLHPEVDFEALKPGMEIIVDKPLKKRVTTKDGDDWSEFGAVYVVERNDGTTTKWKPQEEGKVDLSGFSTDTSFAFKPNKQTVIPAHVLLERNARLKVVEVTNVPGMNAMQAICEVIKNDGVVFVPGGDIGRGGDARVEASQIKSVREADEVKPAVPLKEFLHEHPVSIRAGEGSFRKG
jgi:hypothetical protein